MIDRDARNRAAALVEGFWSGTTTNRQLEAAWPSGEDKGLDAVFDFVWGLYDDFKKHTAREADLANPKLNDLMANCVRFLRSDEPYTWPHSGCVPGGGRYPRWAVWASRPARSLEQGRSRTGGELLARYARAWRCDRLALQDGAARLGADASAAPNSRSDHVHLAGADHRHARATSTGSPNRRRQLRPAALAT